MLSKEHVAARLREQGEYLRTEFSVKAIGLFGSLRTGTHSQESDVDLVIEFSRPIGFRFMELAEYLELLLGAPVDLLTPEGIEGIRNPEIAESIKRSVEYV